MIVLVPSTIALLAEYASESDPVAELRAACRSAVGALAERHPTRVAVVAGSARADNVARGVDTSPGLRIAAHLLAEAGFEGVVGPSGDDDEPAVLVVANGSARRSEKAPGYLDERSLAFDDSVDAALRSADGPMLGALDASLAEQLWCHDAAPLQALGQLLEEHPPAEVEVAFDGDPFGVRYWVVIWR